MEGAGHLPKADEASLLTRALVDEDTARTVEFLSPLHIKHVKGETFHKAICYRNRS